MNEEIESYVNKFIRNGIVGLLIGFLLLFKLGETDSSVMRIPLIFVVAGLVWLFLGLRFRKKLKEKKQRSPDEKPEMITGNSSKVIQFLFSLMLAASLLLSLRHWKGADYLCAVTVIAYTAWLYSRIKAFNSYLNS